jgi:carboxylate-amine ligase
MTVEAFTVGVEEEFLIVDAETRALRPRAERLLAVAKPFLGERVQYELNLAQIEVGTAICHSLGEVRDQLKALRSEVMAAAEQEGSRIVAAGTHPFSEWLSQQITPRARYLYLDDAYQQLAWEQLVCGCHVHVCIPDRDLAIAIMDRVRPWLAVLLALGANSPFWQGVDTGYASFRTQVFDRWPTTGTPHVLGDRAAYDAVVAALVSTGSIDDASRIYWDVRPSMRYETLEFRVADVCTTVDETVMIAGLARALARTCQREELAGTPIEHARPELLRAARWRASRYGMSEQLIDVEECALVPAQVLVERLLAYVRDDLEEHGEWDELRGLVRAAFAHGSGAARQRDALERHGEFPAVVDALVAETAA